jgi:hypothetical protein
MPDYTKKEIALILQAAEILKKNQSALKINVSAFCEEAVISRKNAYKHKKKFDLSVESRAAKIKQLETLIEQLQDKLQLAELRAQDADLYWELRNILVALNQDYKKKGPGKLPKRLQLINEYNRISSLLGLESLSCWESTEES